MLAEFAGRDVFVAVIAAAGLVLAGAIPVMITTNRRSNIRDTLGSIDARLGLLQTMIDTLRRDQERHQDWHTREDEARNRGYPPPHSRG